MTEKEVVMVTPAIPRYKDLHAGMQADLPSVTQERLETYLMLYSKTFEEKSKDFYEQRYLNNIHL